MKVALLLAIAAWGLVHSFLAAQPWKALLRRIFGASFPRFYRLLYNLFSAISLAPILYLMLRLPDAVLYRVPNPWSIAMRIGQVGAGLFLFIALLQTDVLSFVGLRQLGDVEQPAALVTAGLYRWVRHPLYFFGLLGIWLSPTVSVNSFTVYLAFTLYLLVGTIFEERKLLHEYGQAYADYRSTTPMLIPSLRKARRNK